MKKLGIFLAAVLVLILIGSFVYGVFNLVSRTQATIEIGLRNLAVQTD
jgi:hypothetical protein